MELIFSLFGVQYDIIIYDVMSLYYIHYNITRIYFILICFILDFRGQDIMVIRQIVQFLECFIHLHKKHLLFLHTSCAQLVSLTSLWDLQQKKLLKNYFKINKVVFNQI